MISSFYNIKVVKLLLKDIIHKRIIVINIIRKRFRNIYIIKYIYNFFFYKYKLYYYLYVICYLYVNNQKECYLID